MYKIITLAAAASLLTLTACNREAETAPAVDDAASADAISADSAGADASTRAAAGSSGTMTTGNATSASETMAPAGSSTASPTGTGVGPVTDETRANAQTAAEETNLHPKPPAN